VNVCTHKIPDETQFTLPTPGWWEVTQNVETKLQFLSQSDLIHIPFSSEQCPNC